MIEELVQRENILQVISKFKDKNVIKVFTGIRRSGKSYLLKLFFYELKKSGIDENQLIYIDFEDFENQQYLDVNTLYEFIKTKNQEINKRLYLLFDEIQEVSNWEKLINSLFSSSSIDCDIYITGSNAKLLSSELSTYISGRYVQIPIFPLSYKEFLFFSKQEDASKSFNDFMKVGGFPGLRTMYGDENSIRSYIDGIYSTVLLKDVIAKNKIRDTAILEKIILYLCDNLGNIFSAKRIADFMKSNGRQLGIETVYNDLQFLQDALFCYKVPRYDIKGKKLLETMEKYYIADQGIRFRLLGYKDSAINGLLENIVFLELIRRGYQVSIGKIGEYEIDFIAEKEGKKEYYQVCYLLSSEDVKIREYRSLMQIKDNFPKTILSLDELPDSFEEGILRKNLRQWLLECLEKNV